MSETVEPLVIPREAHPISRRNISPAALKVLYGLRDAGYKGYLVGGAVRDLLAGRQPKDFDVATDATPEQVRDTFRNCRLIGRRFRLAHVVYGREIIEVATFRANDDDGSGDRETEDDGRVVRDNVYGTIEDDAVRRDFTANALYYAIEDFSVRDYVGGYEDVLARRLKLIGDPVKRYREDPVRMLRAVRLAAKLDFEIDDSAAAPMPELAPLIAGAAPARLFDESLKLFLAGHGEASFVGLERHHLLPALLPETAEALRTNRSGLLRAMVLDGLRSTDKRIAEDKPVTPAFLYAVLLWPAYCRELARLQAQGLDAAVAQQRAADRVTLHQAQRIAAAALSLPMQEIWMLQPRFALRQKKRVFRTLAHPRFRAAFDFLELRAKVAPELAADLLFWREAQLQAHGAIADAGDEGFGADVAEARTTPRRTTLARVAAVAVVHAAVVPEPAHRHERRPAAGRPRRRGAARLDRAGGNLGDVAATLDSALRMIDPIEGVRLVRHSRRYRTPAWGKTDQPDFINAVAELETAIPPLELLSRLQDIERAHGRDRAREQRWGPRTLDLDLLAIDGITLDTPALQLPHPRLAERAFVLVPWAEIAPDLALPGLGRIADLRDALDRSGIEAIP